MRLKVLLVEPNFPFPTKSKNKASEIHKNFVPIGLLKIGAYYKSLGNLVYLVRGNVSREDIKYCEPNLILITSIFTYWSKYVWDAVEHYRNLFPHSKIMIGGIYATLHYDKKYFQNNLKKFNATCHVGLHNEAEQFYPDYTLLGKIDYHATHVMRGCIRRCSFCGTWKIEPKRTDKTSAELIEELKSIGKNRVVFFDNNFLANRNIKQILNDLAELKINKKPLIFESQSGFDGRLLEKDPELAMLLRKARFQNVRIAWDNSLSDFSSITKQINYLVKAGYKPKDISVFMIYNFNITYEEMLQKIEYCKNWGVQITDCRYRPLESTEDNYNPSLSKRGQTREDYYIHTKAGWTDEKVRAFRKKVREHNIWVRYAKDKGSFYNKEMEKWSAIHNTFKFFKMGRPPKLVLIEKSISWKKRVAKMNRVKSFFKKNNILSNLDFSKLSLKKIDEELEITLVNINDQESIIRNNTLIKNSPDNVLNLY